LADPFAFMVHSAPALRYAIFFPSGDQRGRALVWSLVSADAFDPVAT